VTNDISIRGVSKQWGARPVLAGLDLDVRAGEIVAVLGRSGTGKSTLLRIIAGLEAPDTGEIRIGGVDLTGTRPGERGVGMVFQHSPLLPHLSVGENIGFGISRRRRLTGDAVQRVERAASLVGCRDLVDRRPDGLSGGERQRVALARALVRTPDVVLLDEPLSSLDVHDRADVRGVLRDALLSSGSTAIHVTHDQAEAFAVADRVAVVDGGTVQQVGTADDLYERPANVTVARLVGSPRINLLVASGGSVGPFVVPGDVADGQVVGIRPAAFTVVSPRSDGAVNARVRSVEIADDVAVVRAEIGTGTESIVVTLTTGRNERPTTGDEIGLAREVARHLVLESAAESS
jgi:ABC-type sugar transport system ATPase subunit